MCEVRIQDYRDVTGTFDRITSVGMFEHVGLKNLQTYFKQVNKLLADGGVAMNHGITSTDPDSKKSTPFGGGDFIDRYVFPNGELPHISLALREMASAGLEVLDVENLRRHYALTLEHWPNALTPPKNAYWLWPVSNAIASGVFIWRVAPMASGRTGLHCTRFWPPRAAARR